MTKKEYVDRNIGMTFDFIKHVIDNPKLIERIPEGAELDFIDKDIPIKEKAPHKKKKGAQYKVIHTFEPINA